MFDGEFSYQGLAESLASQGVAYTVEFYPEEGKYHFTGHRKCGVRQTPAETQEQGSICPVCQRPLTLGVLHRVTARFPESPSPEVGGPGVDGLQDDGLQDNYGFVRHRQNRPPFIRLVPLVEIIADVWGRGSSTKSVSTEYARLTREFGSELQLLLHATAGDLMPVAGEALARAILGARTGDVEVDSGYDGVYGRISVNRPPA